MPYDNRLQRRVRQMIGKLYTHLPALGRRWGRRFDALSFAEIPFTRLRKPLRECRVALITTGGVHRHAQPAYDMVDLHGDPSYRVIPAGTPASDLTITHDYYDHADAERDLNVLFPLELFRELVSAGKIGALATCYSFMGHIEPPHVETLLHVSAPRVAAMLKQEQVDAVLLTPA